METQAIRNALGIRKNVKEDASPKFAVTLTGKSVKGIKPVTIVVEAPTGKAACAALKALFLNHKLSVEKV